MKLNRKQQEITRAFHRALNSHDGEIVMNYLLEEYGHAPIDDNNPIKMATGVGARNLVMDIITILKRGETNEQIYDDLPE